MTDEVQIQRNYYAQTATSYDSMHLYEKDEHFFALSWMLAIIDFYELTSILDVGAGTGRTIAYLKQKRPDIRVVGIEPVAELREVGYQKNISRKELIEGDATKMPFPDNSFDLVCEFAVLHHIRTPDNAVREMLRVANKAVFISDANRFGQGSPLARFAKTMINSLGLWAAANYVKTRGKGYMISEGDGLAYSYSVFDNYNLIRSKCRTVHLLNTHDANKNLFRTASHVALLGVK